MFGLIVRNKRQVCHTYIELNKLQYLVFRPELWVIGIHLKIIENFVSFSNRDSGVNIYHWFALSKI